VKIDRELVRRVARLAALDLAEGEDVSLAEDLTRVVEHFEALKSVPDDLLPPLPEPPPMPLRGDGPPREPGARPFAVANAPETAHGHFVVPRVVSRNG
jgi:aspartyl/glutamyl-tRNA(Asn/Gln) amidotransferase C subunit